MPSMPPLRRLVALTLVPAALLSAAAPAFADDLVVTVERTVSTSERPSVNVRATATAPVNVSLLRVNRGDVVAGLGMDVTRPEGVKAALEVYARDVRTRNADLLPAAQRMLPAPSEGTLRRAEFDPLPAGLYVVAADQAGLKAAALLLVSDVALVTKRDEGGLLAWAVERTRGTPRAGVGVRVQRGRDVLAQGSTDAQGLVRLLGDFPAGVHVVAQDGDQLAFGSERWFSPRAPSLRVYLATHQPAYRPGERVEVRGIVRGTDEGGRPILAPGVTTARLSFVAADERVLGTFDVPVSEYLGTFAAGFDLPDDAPTGAGQVRAEIGGDPHAGPLLIDAYRRPPFAVAARAAKPRVLAGEETRFGVEARGYDGALLPGAAVTWALMFHRVEPDLFPADELAQLFFGTEQEAFAPTTLFEGSGALDAEGRLEVVRSTSSTLGDGYVTLRATVVGPDGMHVTGSGVCGVAAAPVRVALKTDRHLYGPEDALRVVVRVERADGAPAAQRSGVLTLAREEVRAGAAPEQVWLENRPFATDERGEARLELGLRSAGRYVVLATVERTADEPAGPPAAAEIGVWCAGETTTLGYAGERLDVIADKDDYAPGEIARVLVLSPLAGRPLLATVEGATLVDARLLTPAGTSALWTLRLDEGHVPNVWLTCLGVDHGNLVTGQRMLRLPPRSRLLAVEVAPDAAEVGPAATSAARLTVRDAAGKPVDGAEVSLAVVDEALHALFPNPGVAVEAFFHPPRRNGVGTGGPLHLVSVGHGRRAPPPAKGEERASGARPAPTLQPPGSPAPPAAAPSPQADPAAPAPSEPASDTNGGPTFGAEGEAPARERPQDLDGASEGLEELEKQKDGAGPPTAATRADFRTAVHWSPALRTGADGSVRVEGIRYADTLTRWRLSALAVDANTRVGTGRGEVRTQRDIAVDVTLPRFLRVGDRSAAPLTVSNLTSARRAVSSWAWWSRDPIEPETHAPGLVQVAPGTFLKPSELGVTQVDAGVALRAGTLDLQGVAAGKVYVLAGAQSGTQGDRVRREIPVRPQGIAVRHAGHAEGAGKPGGEERVEVAVDIPGDVERGTRTATLRVESTLLEAAIAALPSLIDFPYGCTEQTLSRFEPLLVVAAAAQTLDLPETGLLARVPRLVHAGIERLAQLQGADGGFGWWPGDGLNPEMTARALRALVRAREFGIEGASDRAGSMAERAAAALAARWPSLDVGDAPGAALVLAALAEAGALPAGALERALDTLGAAQAAPVTRALFLHAVLAAQRAELAGELVARLAASDTPGTVGSHFGAGNGEGARPARWQDDAIEATAVVLRALFEAGYRGPALGSGARWLMTQRVNGDAWRSTRDTAAAVAFLVPYGLTLRRAQGSGEYRVFSGERHVATVRRADDDRLAAAATAEIPASVLDQERVALTVVGPGGFGVTLLVHGWATGPAIAGREHGLKVARRWFRLDAQPADSGVVYVRTPVTETVPAGTLLECEVEVSSDRAREYVQVTDPYAAGFEPERDPGLRVKDRAPALAARLERYDDRAEFFVTALPAGTHVLRHLVRATHAGAYTALPAQARLMYFPELGGSSQGEQLEVAEATGGAR